MQSYIEKHYRLKIFSRLKIIKLMRMMLIANLQWMMVFELIILLQKFF